MLVVVDDWGSRLDRLHRLRRRGRLARSSYNTDSGESEKSEDVGELHDGCFESWLFVLKVLVVVLDDVLSRGVGTPSYRCLARDPCSNLASV